MPAEEVRRRQAALAAHRGDTTWEDPHSRVATHFLRAAADLKAAGYAIFGTDAKNSQVELSACADASGTWHLAAISDFAATCE